MFHSVCVYVVIAHLLSRFWLFATQSTAALQASLTFIISWCLLKLMFIELVIPSNHLILCCPLLLLLFSFSQHQGLFQWVDSASGGQWIGVSTSASVLPINILGWFPLGLTGWISLQAKGLSGVFSSITVRKHWFRGAQPSLWGHMDEAQSDRCPCKKRWGCRHSKGSNTSREGTDIYSPGEHRQESPCWHFDLGLPASGTVGKETSIA